MIKVNGARIVQAMVELDMGVRELCVRAGVDHRTLKKALNEDRMIRIDSVSRIAKTLNIPVVELIIDATAKGPEEIAASQRRLELEMLKKERAAIDERIGKLEEEMGLIDSPQLGPEFPRREVKGRVRISLKMPKAAPESRKQAKG